MNGDKPAATVIVVSDYGGRTAEDWNYLRQTLRGLARQDFDRPVEVILLDSTPAGEVMPADVAAILPTMRVIKGTKQAASELLNQAVRAASADLVALLDGDCAPVAGWLRAAVDALHTQRDCAAVSGRTIYSNDSFRNRVLAVLSRSFLDPGGAGRTHFISSNNAILRRESLLAHPLAAYPRALAARLQCEAIRLSGGALYFEPRMQVTHRFEGWPMERRIRRHVGYRAVRIRQLDPRVPHAWLLRFGRLSIPLFLAARTLESWGNCLRAGRFYGLRWFELPAALVTAVGVHLLEIGGMMAAFSEAQGERGTTR